jgi:hypothetical protein
MQKPPNFELADSQNEGFQVIFLLVAARQHCKYKQLSLILQIFLYLNVNIMINISN